MFSACCKKELPEPPIDIVCPSGFELQGDSCFCPSGNFIFANPVFSANKECRARRDDEFMTIFSTDCNCYFGDTMIISFDWANTTYTIPRYSYTSTESFDFIDNNDGTDSIITHLPNGLNWTSFAPCSHDSIRIVPKFVGVKFGLDSIVGKFYFFPLSGYITSPPVDSCDVLFTK